MSWELFIDKFFGNDGNQNNFENAMCYLSCARKKANNLRGWLISQNNEPIDVIVDFNQYDLDAGPPTNALSFDLVGKHIQPVGVKTAKIGNSIIGELNNIFISANKNTSYFKINGIMRFTLDNMRDNLRLYLESPFKMVYENEIDKKIDEFGEFYSIKISEIPAVMMLGERLGEFQYKATILGTERVPTSSEVELHGQVIAEFIANRDAVLSGK